MEPTTLPHADPPARTRRPGTARPSASPAAIVRITEAAAVAAVQAFYGRAEPRHGAR